MSENEQKPRQGGIAARVAAEAEKNARVRKPAGAAGKDAAEDKTDVEDTVRVNESDTDQAKPLADPLANPIASNVRDRPASGSASGLVNTAGGTRLPSITSSSISLANLVGGGVDPDRDLIAAGARVPRYLKAALTLTAQLTRNSRTPLKEQDLLREALLAYLPKDIVEQAYDNALTNKGFA